MDSNLKFRVPMCDGYPTMRIRDSNVNNITAIFYAGLFNLAAIVMWSDWKVLLVSLLCIILPMICNIVWFCLGEKRRRGLLTAPNASKVCTGFYLL